MENPCIILHAYATALSPEAVQTTQTLSLSHNMLSQSKEIMATKVHIVHSLLSSACRRTKTIIHYVQQHHIKRSKCFIRHFHPKHFVYSLMFIAFHKTLFGSVYWRQSQNSYGNIFTKILYLFIYLRFLSCGFPINYRSRK